MLPFGHLLGTLGAQMLLLGSFGGSLKFNVCWKGLDAHFASKMPPKGMGIHVTFGSLFGTFFQRVPHSVKSTLKVTFFIKNTMVSPCVSCIICWMFKAIHTWDTYKKYTVFRQCRQWLAESNRYPAGQVQGANHFQLFLIIRTLSV